MGRCWLRRRSRVGISGLEFRQLCAQTTAIGRKAHYGVTLWTHLLGYILYPVCKRFEFSGFYSGFASL